MAGHPIFDDERRNSRSLFRRFIRDKGWFGRRKTEEELAEEKEKEEREKGGKKKESDDKESGQDSDKEKADTEEKKDAEEKKTPRYKYILRIFTPYRKQLALLLTLSLLGVASNASMPWAGKIFIDIIFPSKNLRWHCYAIIVLTIIAALSILITFMQDLTARRVIGNFATSMKRQMMKHLQQLPLARLQDLKVGGIMTRLQSDTDAMAGLMHQGLLTPFNALLMLGTSLVSFYLISPKVMFVALFFITGIVGISYFFFRVMRPFQKAMREELSKIGGHLNETFGGIQVVRAFRRERGESKAFGVATDLLWRKSLHATILNMVAHRSIWTIYKALTISFWGYGGYLVIKGELQVGDLVVFVAFTDWFFGPVFMIMHSFTELQTSLACAERVFDLLDEPIAMPDRPGSVFAESIEGDITFDKVVFEYPDGTRALNSLDLVIPHGKVTALVGPSGAGKSTVTNLVMRFYDVTEGEIKIGDRDIRDFKLASYRRLMSLVLQDVFLFDGSVKDNISYGLPGAKQEEVEAVAKIAHAHEFVEELEKKYDTVIGERGVKLSGGQKQRVALARAIIANPQVLILDEATSSLDSESEGFIQDALRHIFVNRTTLVIAHRLSTVLDADNIVVLDKGTKVEEGKHEELLERKGRYYDLYTKQMKKVERSREVLDWEDENGEK